jgi:hypothetical protein
MGENQSPVLRSHFRYARTSLSRKSQSVTPPPPGGVGWDKPRGNACSGCCLSYPVASLQALLSGVGLAKLTQTGPQEKGRLHTLKAVYSKTFREHTVHHLQTRAWMLKKRGLCVFLL